eukprot:6040269-Amphidinium_carterae.1
MNLLPVAPRELPHNQAQHKQCKAATTHRAMQSSNHTQRCTRTGATATSGATYVFARFSMLGGSSPGG